MLIRFFVCSGKLSGLSDWMAELAMRMTGVKWARWFAPVAFAFVYTQQVAAGPPNLASSDFPLIK